MIEHKRVQGVSKSYLATLGSAHRRHFGPVLGRMALRKVHRRDVEAMSARLLCAGTSPKTGLNTLKILLDCMDMGVPKWHAAVSTLLPIIEGVIADKSGVLDGMRVGRRIEKINKDDEGTPEDLIVGMVSYPALRVIDAEVFAKRDFATTAPNDSGLNRHTILHGITGGYGNRENAVRALMTIAALAELFDGPLALRSSRHPTTDATLIRDFGPIARLRRPSSGPSGAD